MEYLGLSVRLHGRLGEIVFGFLSVGIGVPSRISRDLTVGFVSSTGAMLKTIRIDDSSEISSPDPLRPAASPFCLCCGCHPGNVQQVPVTVSLFFSHFHEARFNPYAPRGEVSSSEELTHLSFWLTANIIVQLMAIRAETCIECRRTQGKLCSARSPARSTCQRLV